MQVLREAERRAPAWRARCRSGRGAWAGVAMQFRQGWGSAGRAGGLWRGLQTFRSKTATAGPWPLAEMAGKPHSPDTRVRTCFVQIVVDSDLASHHGDVVVDCKADVNTLVRSVTRRRFSRRRSEVNPDGLYIASKTGEPGKSLHVLMGFQIRRL